MSPQRNPNNPEKRLMRSLRTLAFGGTISKEEAQFARSYRERGSWNWMGLARIVWLWHILSSHYANGDYGQTDINEAIRSAEDWFTRQEAQGHMLDEMLTSSHYELYLAIAAGARKLALDHGLTNLANLSAAWWVRQEALVTLCWVSEDGGSGNALFPCARAGHGGVSQGVAVCHQLLRGLPLDPAVGRLGEKFYAQEDMLGPALVRYLVQRASKISGASTTMTVGGAHPLAGLCPGLATVADLPPDQLRLINPITIERGAASFRAYAGTWFAGADPCLWVHWAPETGRRVEWLGKKTPHQGEVPELDEPVVQIITIGPLGYTYPDLSRTPGRNPDPAPPTPVPVPTPTPMPDPKPENQLAEAVRGAVLRLREIAKVRPAAAPLIREVADELEAALPREGETK